MAVAFDAYSRSGASTSPADFNWTHTPVGTPRGVTVYVVQNIGLTDEVIGVTYGGVAMTRVAHNAYNAAEDGAVYAYFLGTNIPTGAQTVAVDVNATGSSKMGRCYTVTADADTEVVSFDDTSISAIVANPSASLPLNGRTCFVSQGIWAAPNAVGSITPFTNWTDDTNSEIDFGSQVGAAYRYTVIGSTDVTFGWTQASDDALCIAVAVAEVVGATTVTPDPVAATFTATDPTVSAPAPAVRPREPVKLFYRPGARRRGLLLRRRLAQPIVRAASLAEVVGASITPSPVVATFAATTPTVVPGQRTLAPDPTAASFSATAPTVVRGVKTAAPAPVTAQFSATTPATSGATTVAPAPVSASFSVTTPTVTLGVVPKRAAPFIFMGKGRRARPRRKARPVIRAAGLVVYGPQTIAPAPVAAAFTATTPSLVKGMRTLTPSPATASFATVQPTVTGGVPTVVRRRQTVFVFTSRARQKRRVMRRRQFALQVSISYQPGSLVATISPSPIAAAFTATTPTVVRGARSLAPTPVAAQFTATTPKLNRRVQPGAAVATFEVPSPGISTGNQKNPPPTEALFTATTPTVVRGTRTLTPTPVVATFTATAPTVRRKQFTQPAAAVFSATTPTTSGTRTLSPAPVTATFTVTTPSVLRGTKVLTPSAVAAAFTVLNPQVGIFGLILAKRLGVTGGPGQQRRVRALEAPVLLQRTIIIDHTKVGGATLTNFPMVFAGTFPYLRSKANGGLVESSNGYDIRPFADQALTVPLQYELASYDPVTGDIELWVKIPSLSHLIDTTFYLSYGNAAIVADGSTAQTWSEGFEAVLHLGEDANDSSPHGRHGTPTDLAFVGGQVHKSGDFNGSTAKVAVPMADVLQQLTLSAWIRPRTFGVIAGRIMDRNNSSNFLLAIQDETTPSNALLYHTANVPFVEEVINVDEWALIHVVHFADTSSRWYKNGAEIFSTAGQLLPASSTADIVIGNRANGQRGFDGLIDEARIASVPRSAGWALAEFNNQGNPSTFYSIDSPTGQARRVTGASPQFKVK